MYNTPMFANMAEYHIFNIAMKISELGFVGFEEWGIN
jgi:hypothetical protein